MNYITIIDLGTTKVVGLVGEKTPFGYKIIAFSEHRSQGVKRGEVENILQLLTSINPCIVDLESQIGKRIKNVYVGIAGQHIRSQSECNKVNRNSNQNEIITWEEINTLKENMYFARVEPGEKVLHVIPQFYHVDEHLEIDDPVGMIGSKIEANYRLFIGKTNSALNTHRALEQAGLKVERIILEPLASALAVLTEDEKELGVAMVDIGGGTTDVLVYEDNVIRHAAVIPFGGNVITEDIRQGCSVPLRKAEEIKVQFGSCYSDLAPANKTIVVRSDEGETREISFGFLANIIEARMSEIIEAVLFEIENSGYADRLHRGIVLTGGGALMNNLVEYVKYKTGYFARVAKPLPLDEGPCTQVYHCAYSCAVGLLLMGFEYKEGHTVGKKPIIHFIDDLFGFGSEPAHTSRKEVKKQEPMAKESVIRKRKVADVTSEDKRSKESGHSFEERFNRFFQIDNGA